jgi:hypothetical protein
MKFRRRQKILPGVYLNFSGSGISTTIGGRGASVNIGRNGAYLNTGIPGTGLYNRQRIDHGDNSRSQGGGQNSQIVTSGANTINSNIASALTSRTLIDLKDTFHECYRERALLKAEIKKAKTQLLYLQILYFLSFVTIIGFFIKWFKNNVNDAKVYINDLADQYTNCLIDIDINLDQNIENHYQTLSNRYLDLCTCTKIWDLISYSTQDQRITRSSAQTSVHRKAISFSSNRINIIKSKFQPLHFANANGGDLYFYPGFIFYFENEVNFALVDLRDLDITLINQQFLEEESVPADAIIVKQTWAKSNADGSPDRRFKNNYQIPICKYGRIDFKTNSGLNESYMFSDYDKTRDFAQSLNYLLQIAKTS